MEHAEDEVPQLLAVMSDRARSQSDRLRARITLFERTLTSCERVLEMYHDKPGLTSAASVTLWREARASANSELEEARRELARVTA